MVTVASAGRISGRITERYTRHSLAPSMRAASLSSAGTERMKLVRTNVAIGIPIAT